MLGKLPRCVILSVILALWLTGGAHPVVDSLRSKLVEAVDLRDSVRILYNIYDSSPHSLQAQTLDDLYDLAVSREDYATVGEVLKRSAIHFAADDSMQHVIIGRAEKMPDGPEKQSTLGFVNVMIGSLQARAIPEEEREAKLRDLLTAHKLSEGYDTYRRIEYLFRLCTLLNLTTEGELLTPYMQELQTLIDALPAADFPLKYLFYYRAAPSYLSKGMIDEAVAADTTLLGIIGEFEQHNAAIGRTSRSYDREIFESYSRLLRCHEALTQDEVDDYYARLTDMIARDPEILATPDEGKKATISYMMAKNRYADALPLIKEQLKDSSMPDGERLYLVDAMLEAAEAVGDKTAQLAALDMSNAMLKERIEKKATASYKELQIVSKVAELQRTNEELTQKNQEIAYKRHKSRMVFGIVVVVVLAGLLLTVFVLYRRSKRLTSNLTKANAMIEEERDALRRTQNELIDASEKARMADRIKTDFVSNMGHEIRSPLESVVEYSGLIADCAAPERREYIKQFSDVITLNSHKLLTLVNNVLSLPSLENAKVGVSIVETSLQDLCLTVIDAVKERIKPGVKLIFANEGEKDTIVMTDAKRVEQVLFNLMVNAAKFTEKGAVTLGYSLSPDSPTLSFTVSDTGIGIPEYKKDDLLTHCEKYGSPTHDISLSLYISRMIADLIGGSLTLDRDYNTGTKFVFTIQIS